MQAKRFDAAEQAIQKALDLSPNPEDQEYALFVQGSIFERQKKYDQAEQTFKKVLSVDPLNSSASNYLGYMLADRGVRLEESVKYIQKALELEPNNGAYLDSLGWAYFKMGRYDLAEPPLEKAASKIQNDPTIHEHLGNLYLRMGKTGHGAGGVAARPEGMARSRLQRFRRRAGQAASEATRRPQEPPGAWQSLRTECGSIRRYRPLRYSLAIARAEVISEVEFTCLDPLRVLPAEPSQRNFGLAARKAARLRVHFAKDTSPSRLRQNQHRA